MHSYKYMCDYFSMQIQLSSFVEFYLIIQSTRAKCQVDKLFCQLFCSSLHFTVKIVKERCDNKIYVCQIFNK